MRAGRLRHRITLQSSTAMQDAYGQPVKTWTDTATVYAGVEPIGGREQYRAQAERAELTHLVVMRFISVVMPCQSLFFSIRAICPRVTAVIDPTKKSMIGICVQPAE